MTHESPLLQHLLARGQARRPVVGAHRGASARAPENTLAAFRAALEDGAESIELDVHLTRDGQLAVIHDATTRRTTGVEGAVAGLTMAELRRLDAGRYHGQEWAGEGIPELGEVLALARGRLLVNVEVKGGPAVVPVLGRRLDEYEMTGSVIVSSFDQDTVRAASALRPRPLTGLLLDHPISDPVGAARAVGASVLHLKHTLLVPVAARRQGEEARATAGITDLMHEAGLGVLAWTVNEADEMRRLAALGVDAILGDDPRLLHELVGECAAEGEWQQ